MEVTIPKIFTKDGIWIGHAEEKGEQIPIFIPIYNWDELFKGYIYQESMGKGKDTAVKNFVVEGCFHHNPSFIAPDAICDPIVEGWQMESGIVFHQKKSLTLI